MNVPCVTQACAMHPCAHRWPQTPDPTRQPLQCLPAHLRPMFSQRFISSIPSPFAQDPIEVLQLCLRNIIIIRILVQEWSLGAAIG